MLCMQTTHTSIDRYWHDGLLRNRHGGGTPSTMCTCAQQRCPLSAGLLTGKIIMCQCDASRFDIATGAVINGPAKKPLNVYEVREVGAGVQIRASPS